MATTEQISLLRTHVGASSNVSDVYLGTVWDRASALVLNFIGDHIGDVPPAEVVGATMEVAAELYHRKNAPNGVSQFADGQGNPVRVARDPMVAAYRTLGAYLPAGIAGPNS